MDEGNYSNIREILGELCGQKLIEITQHDNEYFKRTGRSFIDLMFEQGDVLRFYIGKDGFFVNPNDEFEEEKFGEK